MFGNCFFCIEAIPKVGTVHAFVGEVQFFCGKCSNVQVSVGEGQVPSGPGGKAITVVTQS